MISGNHVKRFADANLAVVVDVHLNADYPHVFFDVVKKTATQVILKSHNTGEELQLHIFGNEEQEFAAIDMKSSFEKMTGQKAKRFRIYPFKGEKA